jgi:hypothetical protein
MTPVEKLRAYYYSCRDECTHLTNNGPPLDAGVAVWDGWVEDLKEAFETQEEAFAVYMMGLGAS